MSGFINFEMGWSDSGDTARSVGLSEEQNPKKRSEDFGGLSRLKGRLVT
jgi:hypothetical protein